MKTKPLTKSLLFFILVGLLIPSFSDFLYFYMLEVAKFSKMTVAVLKMIAFGGIIFGSVLFNLILKKLPIVVLMLITCVIYCLTSGAEVMFLLEVTLGLSPVVFFAVISIFDSAAIQAFFGMPLLAIFAKLVPTSIESSMFAMLTGLINLSFHFLSKILGVLINMFFSPGFPLSNFDHHQYLFKNLAFICI